jgi:hypothetical protein
MPCRKCGSNRIITKQKGLCPNCDGLSLVDKQEALRSRTDALANFEAKFVETIQSTDYNITFGSSVMNRELAANAAIYVASRKLYSISEWLTYSYVLHNLHYNKNSPKENNFSELVSLSKKIVQLHNEIISLEKNLAVIIKSKQGESFE